MQLIYHQKEEKIFHQKVTEGLLDSQKHHRDAKEIIKFVECIENKGEDFGWKLVASNVGPDNLNLFKRPGKLTAEDYKSTES